MNIVHLHHKNTHHRFNKEWPFIQFIQEENYLFKKQEQIRKNDRMLKDLNSLNILAFQRSFDLSFKLMISSKFDFNIFNELLNRKKEKIFYCCKVDLSYYIL